MSGVARAGARVLTSMLPEVKHRLLQRRACSFCAVERLTCAVVGTSVRVDLMVKVVVSVRHATRLFELLITGMRESDKRQAASSCLDPSTQERQVLSLEESRKERFWPSRRCGRCRGQAEARQGRERAQASSGAMPANGALSS